MRLAILISLFALALSGSGWSAEDGHNHQQGADHQDHVEEDDHRAVHLSTDQLERLNVQVIETPGGSAEATLSLPATVHFDANRMAQVGPRLRAKVIRVTQELGAHVGPGDTVAIMDSVALGKVKARYLAARARLETARADYRREQRLAEQQISSQAELLDAQARFRKAQAERDALAAELRLYGLNDQAIEDIHAGDNTPLSRLRLTSPIAGVIQRRDLKPGQTVSADETPIHIVDTRQVWLMIDAYERHLPRLRTGQSVTFQARAIADEHRCRSNWVSLALDEKTRTVRMRAVCDNPRGLLRAGMFGTATVNTGAGHHAAMVPIDAVQHLEGEPVVFVPGHEAQAFRAAPVELGQETGDRVEILQGLEPGDPVVTTGAFDLKSALTAGGRSAAHQH